MSTAFGEYLATSAVTEPTIFMLVNNRSSRLIPGFRGIPAVTTTKSEKEGDDAVADETADILFVAMGHAEAMGFPGIEGLERVTNKSAAKTNETHAIRPDTGKVLPKTGKPHKWQ